ncbi:hypothetical protein DFH08DRAFT_936167 [Mycena albidolilacea]|uniref:Uncharacterized protein n=1 Tax=Mycena albidolilacea TaxID=1033008 RepID=A0AAD7A566_9AGAR|nr:hypothetical protein DFH08DRAFT_936167 [Mycena albidolilacea]
MSNAYLTEVVFPSNAQFYPVFSATSTAPFSSSFLLPSPSLLPPFSSSSLAMSTSIAVSSSSASISASTPATATGSNPTHAPFNYVFRCGGVGYFAWLEGEGWGTLPGEMVTGAGAGVVGEGTGRKGRKGRKGKGGEDDREGGGNPNWFPLEHFGKAMAGTGSWEALGVVLHGSATVGKTSEPWT